MLKWFYRWRLRAVDEKLHFAMMWREQLREIRHVNNGLYMGQYIQSVGEVAELKIVADRLKRKLGE